MGIAITSLPGEVPWMLLAKSHRSACLQPSPALDCLAVAADAGILCGGSASLIVLFGLYYLMRVLEPEDHARLNVVGGMLPSRSRLVDKLLSLLTRLEPKSAS